PLPRTMGLIAKIFGAASKAEAAGASLIGPAWEAEPITDAPAFFRALPDLLPSGSILYLEDVCSTEGIALARRYCIEPQLKLALGTVWPRPKFFHLPLTAASAAELAQFAEHHATPEIGVHIHAYHDDQVLLEWHDAFGQPLRLSTALPESRVRSFCELLHCNYNNEAA
ncbi:MAG: hypothetical protein KF724_13765, partial [Phycisphaeraceae bacterium]|nr:hypothetical protein [Phycisphaeraceae bacterium]